MRLESSLGKDTSAVISLKDLCGSGVTRHIDNVGDVFIGCGSRILAGFRRFCGTMCFLVVVMSHTGSLPASLSVSRRSLVVEEIFCFCLDSLRYLRSALDALWV